MRVCLSICYLIEQSFFCSFTVDYKISATEKLHGDRQQFISAWHEGVWESGNVAPVILNLGFVCT